MKAMMINSILAAAFLAGPLSGSPVAQGFTTASAQSTPCTNASWNGDYGFLKVEKIPEGPLNSIGSVTFDGQGNWLSHGQTFDINGQLSPPGPGGGTGTYNINPDCSGTQMDAACRWRGDEQSCHSERETSAGAPLMPR